MRADGNLTIEVPSANIRVSDIVTASILEAGTDNGPASAEGIPLTWQNSSMFHAANVAIRNSHARRAAHAAAIASTCGSTAVLFPPSVSP